MTGVRRSLLALALLGLTACGTAAAGSSAGAGEPAGSPSDSAKPLFDDVNAECAGAFPNDAVTGPHLSATDVAASGEVCTERTEVVVGDGEWLVRRTATLSADDLSRLVVALRAPDVRLPPDAVCAAIGYVIPPWLLTLADGRHVQPAIPSEGCAPSAAVRQILTNAANHSDTATRVRRLLPQSQVTAGCNDGSKAFIGDSAPAETPSTLLGGATTLSVCRYAWPTGDSDRGSAQGGFTMPTITSTGTGAAVAAAAHAVFDALRPVDATCRTGASVMLQVQLERPAGSALETPPLAAVEVGGCSRVVDAQLRVVGAADPAAVRILESLATEPATTRPCCFQHG
jgi:hypothetical protein